MAVLKDLIVHGPSRFINTANFNSIKANTIGADNGVFNKLIATSADIGSLDVDNLTAQNAMVVGLLDVKGQLHTNSWTNANIANIGGSFYISPTVSTEIAANGTPMSVTISGGSGNRTIAVSGGAFVTDSVKIYQNNTTSTASWAIGSRVMITGNVRLGTTGTDYPLGTCIGYLNASLTTSGFTIAEVNSPALESIISTIGTSLKSYNIKISMYEIGPKTSEKPVGILLTSYGVDRSTYIDIYGGVNIKNSSGYTEPNVRIGYLGGISSYTDSAGKSHKPTGWGLFTDNGYFKGVIVADSGSIGNFTIDANSIKTGTIATTNGILISPNNTTSYTINGASRTNLRLAIGRYFGVDNDGILYASGANITNINGANITAHTITTTQITTSNLVGTNGWINLAQGTFAYNNTSTGHGISWNGQQLAISADSIFLSGDDISTSIQDAINTANAVDSAVNGNIYYQYTTGGTTYNVLYDEDNNRYYYIDDNDQEVTVTYAQLDKNADNVPVTVTSSGIQSQVNDNTDALGELKQTTGEQIGGLSNQISGVDERLGGQIDGLGSQIGTLSSETSEAIEGLEGRVSQNETNIGSQGQRLGTAESSITNLQKIVIDKYEAFIEVKPSVPSITLGKRNDATVRTRLEITDEAVNFYTDGKNSAKASGKSFESPEGKFEQITMKTVSGVGNLRWIARSNRHLSLKKITGDN